MQAILQQDSVVIHTTGVYLLDAQGRERTYLDEGFDPKVAASNLRLLLTEPANTKAAATASATPKGEVLQTQQTADGSTIALTATPGQFGTYTFTVSTEDATGVPIQNAAVTADLTMSAMPMEPVHVTLGPLSPPIPGAYRASGVISMAGQWKAIVQVSPLGGAQSMRATFTFTTQY